MYMVQLLAWSPNLWKSVSLMTGRVKLKTSIELKQSKICALTIVSLCHICLLLKLRFNFSTNFLLNSRQYENYKICKVRLLNLLVWFSFMVLNSTFNNISVISWRPVLLVEETGVPWENHRPIASNWQTLSHYVVSSTGTPWFHM